MSGIELISKQGTKGVRKLRETKLKSGLPFMINTTELGTNQCYLEYPNGSIKLVVVKHSSRVLDVLRELTSDEASELRKRFHFSYQK